MTEGPLFRKIVLYTVPIIFSGVLQLLFNAVDLVVVGRFCGEISLAAVGATGSLINLLVNLFIGLSVGAGICVARALGAGDKESVQNAIHTAMPVAIICGLVLTAVGVPLSRNLLALMDTPDNVIGLSSVYMQIYFSGAVFSMTYNFGAAILRATGDTNGPLAYLSIAGIINVLLNIFFVSVFDMNVAGVALATVISQAVSATLVVINLMRRTDICRFNPRKMRIRKNSLLSIMRIGIPSGIQSAFFSISNVINQSSINSFGDIAMSGVAAASSIEGFVYNSMNAFMHTTQNFVSQNYGAKKFDRILRVVLISVATVTVVGLALGVTTYLLATPLLSIYISDSQAAIEYGIVRIAYIGLTYFLCGIMETVAGAIRGLGASISPMFISLIGACAFRVVWIFTVFQIPKYHTLECIYVGYPISWILTIAAHATLFLTLYFKKKKAHLKEFAEEQAKCKV